MTSGKKGNTTSQTSYYYFLFFRTFFSRGWQTNRKIATIGFISFFLSFFLPFFISSLYFFVLISSHVLAASQCVCEVVDLLKVSTGEIFGRQQMLFNRPVCQNAFRRLLGIGSGRYTRLKRAAVTGTAPPLDGRYIKKPFIANNSCAAAKRACIVEFLTELESTLSEPMPEANQSTARLRATAIKVVAEGEAGGSQAPATEAPKMKFRRNRGRRPRLAGLLHRGKDFSGMRLLPPGSLSDYLSLLHARYPDQKVSLKLFSRAPCFDLARWLIISCEFCRHVMSCGNCSCQCS